MPKIAVIINAGSGTKSDNDALVKQIEERFAAHDITAEVHCAADGEELLKFAAEMAESDIETIVAGGGDGTISAVATEVIKANKTLGVLPLGTLNHFSKDLKIPQLLEEAIALIAAGHATEIDVGEVNGRIFLNNSSIGLYPRIVHKREKQQQRLGRSKWYAAFWAAVAVLRRYSFLRIRLNIAGKNITRKTPFVFIGNNEYAMEGWHVGARPRLDTGKLSLYIVHRTWRLGLIILAIRSLLGILKQAKDLDVILTEEIEIFSKKDRSFLVAFDGEVTAMRTPLEYKIRPRALRVIVSNE
jgi:YegS/Rv2252/BmrU family lipid kinase